MNGGIPVEARSRSTGMGLPVRHMDVWNNSNSHSNNMGTSVSLVSPNVQLRVPRTRSVSSNAAVESMRVHFHPQLVSPPPSSVSNAGQGSNGQVPRSRTGLTRQPPASLMDIFAHQQRLQQYSNQRAQLSPARSQQAYDTQNSRSTPSLGSPSSPSSPSPSSPRNAASSSPTTKTMTHQHSYSISGTSSPVMTNQGEGPSLRGDHSSSSPQQRPLPEKPATDRVVVVFESVSLSSQDPNTVAGSLPIPSPPAVPKRRGYVANRVQDSTLYGNDTF